MEIIPNWHPVIVHFTIALLVIATLLFIFAVASRSRSLGISATLAGRWNLAFGTLAAVGTVGTGWVAYNTVAHDEPSHINMTTHMWWALGTTAVFIVAAVLAWLDRRRAVGASAMLLVALVVGSAALVVTGWYGAENVYRFGLGVKSMPQADHHEHMGGADDDHAKSK